MPSQRCLKLLNQLFEVREDGVSLCRYIMTVRQDNFTIDGIRTGRPTLIIVSVLQLHEGGVVGFGDLLNRIILVSQVIQLLRESLIVHAEHDVGQGVIIVTALTTGCVCLIDHQRRFGSEDTHIVDDEVITIIIRRHIIYAYAEVLVVLGLLNREIDLIPLILIGNLSGQVGCDIMPRASLIA